MSVYASSILWAFCILCIGIVSVKAVESIEFWVFNSSTETEIKEESIQDNLTYILIAWRGGWNHDAPDLTDTIILLGINRLSQTYTLFSIPRDLWVKYPNGKEGKINRIYENHALSNRQLAISYLKEKVSQITGKEIDYYMSIDFAGFREIVDTLWGVEVTLEKNFVDYKYPDGNLGYKTFILRKWTWTLDGEVALMYARSRHSSSDFDRSLRQQEIINSLKTKISELWYISDVRKIMSLYNIFTKYIETDMSLKDIISLGLEIKSWDNTKALSFNLNDTCYQWSDICTTGGFLYVPLREYFGWASVLLPNTGDSIQPEEFSEIQLFTDLIYNSPVIYLWEKNIHIYNTTRTTGLAGKLWNEIQKYGFDISRSTQLHTLKNWTGTKSVIFVNKHLEHAQEILEALEKITGISGKITTEPMQKHWWDIEIIITENL